ncbi:LysR family transcriptional regulator [Alteromonas pelagimontana]|uniref:LysR family transcriptional regulator n=1 Tax=Alteromonas pelagimontana TaxID=1858656 RepID=A0A6M4M935_9ALTE|nr:LysR family transcriptional regulator [Alteromonas pelagimontana]QJR79701.1 LysR family transcriptional regulator [Alteromonas pelagimontana]
MLDNLRIFITAAEKGSFSGAAKCLSMTIATVSRRIAELEKSLGVELFHRSNKGLMLTSSGNDYYRECADTVNDLSQKLINLDATINDPEGPLKVVAPINIGSGPLNNFWQTFSAAYPQIALNIILADPNESVLSKSSDIRAGS